MLVEMKWGPPKSDGSGDTARAINKIDDKRLSSKSCGVEGYLGRTLTSFPV